jgi:hypothetical protein
VYPGVVFAFRDSLAVFSLTPAKLPFGAVGVRFQNCQFTI